MLYRLSSRVSQSPALIVRTKEYNAPKIVETRRRELRGMTQLRDLQGNIISGPFLGPNYPGGDPATMTYDDGNGNEWKMMPLDNGWALGRGEDSVLYRSQSSVVATLENDFLSVTQWSRSRGSTIFTPHATETSEDSMLGKDMSISYVLDSHLGGMSTDPFAGRWIVENRTSRTLEVTGASVSGTVATITAAGQVLENLENLDKVEVERLPNDIQREHRDIRRPPIVHRHRRCLRGC